jgi:hypothetical protein
MSFPEIVSIMLMIIVGLQMWFIRWILGTSLQTMRDCSDTSNQAMALVQRLFGDDTSATVASHVSNTQGE